MTKEEFAELQLRHQKSGKTLKEYLRETGLGYSTYNYWKDSCPRIAGTVLLSAQLVHPQTSVLQRGLGNFGNLMVARLPGYLVIFDIAPRPGFGRPPLNHSMRIAYATFPS